MIKPTLKPLSKITQHSQKGDLHVLSGIRNPSPRKRAVKDPRLRPRSYRDRQVTYILILFGDEKTS